MNKKIVFLDIDGTLCNDNGLIPESAIKAVQEARKNGHLVYLCTGRSKAEIFDFIMEIGFDGIIGAGGGFVEINGNMLYHKRVSDHNVKHMVDFFNEHDVDYYLESNGGLYASKNLVHHLCKVMYGDYSDEELIRLRKEKPNPFIECMIENENMYRSDINKACFLGSNLPFEMIRKEFEDEFNVMECTIPSFGGNSGELAVPGIHKASAIETLINHLGLNKEDTLAMGDGHNDAEMLQYCEIGIAMGNANENLKQIADDITLTHDEGGIEYSFKKYGLID